MKAVIMAGGEGSRLRPLTCDIPKPMARLLGRPIMEYILDLLGANGVTHAAVTLRYLPDKIIDHFPDGTYGDIALSFVEEDMPLGTAGSVKNACAAGDDGVLVISGDAMCDFDLAAFARFHRESGADVSILGKKVSDPREYGLIDAAPDGSIAGFIEKPAFSQAISDIANTGIYILSKNALAMIPDGVSCDFAMDLFPRMLRAGMKLMCWEGEGYWCDIGDLATYASCQQDMLHGKVRCKIRGTKDSAGNILVGGELSSRVKLMPPCYIGEQVKIEDGAVIEAGSVVDDGSFIGHGARVSGAILLQNSYIAPRAKLTGAIVCAGATVKTGAMLFEGATAGAGSVIGARAIVQAGVKIWNQKHVPHAAHVTEHVKTSVRGREFFDDDGISGEIGVELTPEFCARVGSAIGSLGYERVCIGSSTHASAKVLKSAICAGIQSTGTQVLDFGESFQAQFEFSMNFSSMPLGVYIRGDNRACIKLFSTGGMPAPRDIERSIEGILVRGEFVRCAHDQMGDRTEMTGFPMLYRSQIMRFAPKGLQGCRAQVKSNNLALQNFLKDVLYKLGCDTSSGVRLEISSQGDKVRLFDERTGYIRHHRILTWCAIAEMERGIDVSVAFEAPQVIDIAAKRMGRRVQRYFTCPADKSDEAARKAASIQMWSRDALMQSVLFLHIARLAGGISALMEQTPAFERTERIIETTANPAGVIRQVSSGRRGGVITEGVLLNDPRGVLLVRPLKRGTGIKVFAEAASSEIAAELCDDMQRRIENAMQMKASGAGGDGQAIQGNT